MKRIVNALGKLNWGKRAYAVVVLCAPAPIALPAQTLTTLHSFNGPDGDSPEAALIQGVDGDGYGTTFYGGASSGGTNCYPKGCGTVFKITPSGTLTTLYSFCSQSGCTDGAYPAAAPIQGTNGNFYGTTFGGGANGDGTVFKMTPSGTVTTLYNFCSQSDCTDGSQPTASLLQAANGDFYGTTDWGGSGNDGTVFRLTPSGTLTTLHSFALTDGAQPYAGLIQATDGNFYGTTFGGGVVNDQACPTGCGTVFRITPSGNLSTLYIFCAQTNCADGANPRSALFQAANGDFYGTASLGGNARPWVSCGTIFKITYSGTLTTLYSFCSEGYPECTDGAIPYAGLVRATDGDFYGTTNQGGLGHEGTIFSITLAGQLTTLFHFGGGAFGGDPEAGLIQATSGDFYGTTYQGGAPLDGVNVVAAMPRFQRYGPYATTTIKYGTVFRLSVGLGPFVKTQPTSGKVGAAVKILGADLTGASSVTFNGTAATFTVNSTGTAISTTVPAGATSGAVQVVTPLATLSSNVPFRVL